MYLVKRTTLIGLKKLLEQDSGHKKLQIMTFLKLQAVKWYKKNINCIIAWLQKPSEVKFKKIWKPYITFKYSCSTNAGYVKRKKGQGTRFLGWEWKDKKKKAAVKKKEESETGGRAAHWERHCWTGNRKKEIERQRENSFLKSYMKWSAVTHILFWTASHSKHTPTTTCQTNTTEYSEPQRDRNADWHLICYRGHKCMFSHKCTKTDIGMEAS